MSSMERPTITLTLPLMPRNAAAVMQVVYSFTPAGIDRLIALLEALRPVLVADEPPRATPPPGGGPQ